MDGLYHYLTGLPSIELPSGTLALRYGPHALRRNLELPDTLEIRAAKVIEIEICENVLKKVVYRLWYSRTHDILLAVEPSGWVRTAWLNHKDDEHASINASAYKKVG